MSFQSILRFIIGTTVVRGQVIGISIPSIPPQNASQIIDPGFPGIGIETSSFPVYAGNASHPNLFSRNLVEALNRTGKGTIIRVAGTTGDYGTYIPNQETAIIHQPDSDPNVNSNISVGSSFFEGFATFRGARFVWQAPLARLALANTVEETKTALKAIGLPNLDTIEIGNEPDLYGLPQHSRNSSTWGPVPYVNQFAEFASALESSGIGVPAGKIYQGLVLSSSVGPSWNLQAAFQAGLDENSTIKTISQHYYQIQNADLPSIRLAGTLMNHTSTVSTLSRFKAPIQFLQKNRANIPFVLGEVGSALPIDVPALQGVFGAALWEVDFMLYAMCMNISRVSMHQGTGFGVSSWQPVTLSGTGPHVRPPFYSLMYVGDFIGTSTTLKVSNIDLGRRDVSVYAGYEAGELVKLAVVNLELYNATTKTPRPSQNFEFTLPPGFTQVKVQKLTAPGANSTSDVTWGGMSWTFNSGGRGVQVLNDTEMLNVTNQALTIAVQASEAAMMTMLK